MSCNQDCNQGRQCKCWRDTRWDTERDEDIELDTFSNTVEWAIIVVAVALILSAIIVRIIK